MSAPQADIVKAWQCIGCGKIEAPQTCVGICQDRKVELVYAHDHRALLEYAMRAEALVRQIALITPRAGEWERSYRALQEKARQLLAEPQPQETGSISAGSVPNSR
jgi:hypothetical protein